MAVILTFLCFLGEIEIRGLEPFMIVLSQRVFMPIIRDGEYSHESTVGRPSSGGTEECNLTGSAECRQGLDSRGGHMARTLSVEFL